MGVVFGVVHGKLERKGFLGIHVAANAQIFLGGGDVQAADGVQGFLERRGEITGRCLAHRKVIAQAGLGHMDIRGRILLAAVAPREIPVVIAQLLRLRNGANKHGHQKGCDTDTQTIGSHRYSNHFANFFSAGAALAEVGLAVLSWQVPSWRHRAPAWAIWQRLGKVWVRGECIQYPHTGLNSLVHACTGAHAIRQKKMKGGKRGIGQGKLWPYFSDWNALPPRPGPDRSESAWPGRRHWPTVFQSPPQIFLRSAQSRAAR